MAVRTRQMRIESTRQRVEEWLAEKNAGPTASKSKRLEEQKHFVRRASALGKERGLRVWVENGITPYQNALSSLRYFLKEVTLTNSKTNYSCTGGAHDWVLDLYDLVLAEREACRLTEKREVEVVSRPTPLRLVTPPEEVHQTQTGTGSLGMILLEAYVRRDDDAIMKLALELSKAEIK